MNPKRKPSEETKSWSTSAPTDTWDALRYHDRQERIQQAISDALDQMESWPGSQPGDPPRANKKADVGKPDLAALPLEALTVVARVFQHGNSKYGEDNWLNQDVATTRRYAAAALRHLTARQAGEMLDESGLPHVAHAIASLLILLHHETQPKRTALWP